jgi:hypothetical protein
MMVILTYIYLIKLIVVEIVLKWLIDYDLWKNLFSNSIVSVLQELTRWSKYCRSVNCSKNTSDEYWSKQDFKYDYRASTPAAGYKYNNTI